MNETDQLTKRMARIEVSLGLLHQLLHLPENVQIESVRQSERGQLSYKPHAFEIVVTSDDHPDLPIVHQGETIPLMIPILHTKTTTEFDHMEFPKPFPGDAHE